MQSSNLAMICDRLATRKPDSFHDRKWNWRPERVKKTFREKMLENGLRHEASDLLLTILANLSLG